MYGNANGLNINVTGIVGPWKCSECGEISQYADVQPQRNHIFCRNQACRYERIIDKRNHIIRENDGTFWRFDDGGNKVRIPAQ